MDNLENTYNNLKEINNELLKQSIEIHKKIKENNFEQYYTLNNLIKYKEKHYQGNNINCDKEINELKYELDSLSNQTINISR